METDFQFRNPELFGPVVFRPSFNSFESINATQAWSLFFTASNEDKVLGFSPEIGRVLTYSALAIAAAGAFWALLFQPF